MFRPRIAIVSDRMNGLISVICVYLLLLRLVLWIVSASVPGME